MLFSGNSDFQHNCDIFVLKICYFKFQDFLWNCVILWYVGILNYQEKWPSMPIIAKIAVRISQVFFNVLAFYHFCGQIPKKSKVQKVPLVWLVLDLYFCSVGQFGSTGKSTILVFYLAKSKNIPPHGQGDFHLEKCKFTIFLVKCIFNTSATGTNLSLSRSPVIKSRASIV